MIRELSFIDVLYLIAATRWTLALTAIAFLGGGLVGLAIALLRVSAFAPLRWLGTVYVLRRAGHAAARLAVRLLLRPVDLRLHRLALDRRGGRPIRSMPAPSWARSGAAACRRSRAPSGRPAPRSAWASPSSCATSSCRRRSRLAIPPTVGFLVQLIKNTSLAAVIGFIELTREGQLTTATTFRPFTVYLIVAAIYFALCFPLTQWSRRLERRLHVAR